MATAFNSPKRSGLVPMPEPGPALAPLALGGGALSRRGPSAPSAATHPEVPPLNLNNAPSATDLVDAEESESWLEPMRYRLCRYRWRGRPHTVNRGVSLPAWAQCNCRAGCGVLGG